MKEPNNLPANAQKVNLPLVVNGVIENNDTDRFAFHEEAGETLLFQIAASRLGAGLDS